MALPDAELNITTIIRANVAGTVDVVTQWPLENTKATEVVRVTRLAGGPVSSRPAHLDAALMQVEFYAATKAQAYALAMTCFDALEASPGPAADGVITRVEFGSLVWSPDPERDAGKPAPRYVQTVTVFAHA